MLIELLSRFYVFELYAQRARQKIHFSVVPAMTTLCGSHFMFSLCTKVYKCILYTTEQIPYFMLLFYVFLFIHSNPFRNISFFRSCFHIISISLILKENFVFVPQWVLKFIWKSDCLSSHPFSFILFTHFLCIVSFHQCVWQSRILKNEKAILLTQTSFGYFRSFFPSSTGWLEFIFDNFFLWFIRLISFLLDGHGGRTYTHTHTLSSPVSLFIYPIWDFAK